MDVVDEFRQNWIWVRNHNSIENTNASPDAEPLFIFFFIAMLIAKPNAWPEAAEEWN
jgi:hypothetical protein